MTVLVCGCGMRLKAAGAFPGRVGKCPSCGALLKVPDAPPASSGYAILDDRAAPKPPAARSPSFPGPPRRRRPVVESRSEAGKGDWNGLIAAPSRPETRFRDSLLYPFWGVTGLAYLAFLPPALALTSLPAMGMLALTVNLPGIARVLGAIGLIPAAFGFLILSAFTLLVLGRVLVSSALGEVDHPRWPHWEAGEMARGLGRWLWAGLIGGAVGAVPSVAYWKYCGDIDLLDRVIFAELAALGAAYALMALLASILHEDALGANPVTVLRAIGKVGWGYGRPCLACGVALVGAVTAVVAVFSIESPPLAAFAYWLLWVFLLYEAMVVLRILGLYYNRHARVLGWFRERPRWGV